MKKNDEKTSGRSILRERLNDAKNGIGYDDSCIKELLEGENPIYDILLWHDLIHQDQQKINADNFKWHDHLEKKIRAISRWVNLCIFLLGAILTWIIVFSIRYM